MKTQTFSCLGVDVTLSVPETVEEFDKNAGRVGACLDEGINNVVYRGMLADLRYHSLHGVSAEDLAADKNNEVFVKGSSPIKGIEETSGIDRKTLPVMKDGKQVVRDGQPVEIFDPEDSEGKYFKRVCATKKCEPSAFANIITAVGKILLFNAKATERAATGPKKLAQKYKDLALLFITGKKNLAKLQEVFTKDINKTFTPITEREVDGKKVKVAADDAANVEALGWLCKEWENTQDAFAKVK